MFILIFLSKNINKEGIFPCHNSTPEVTTSDLLHILSSFSPITPLKMHVVARFILAVPFILCYSPFRTLPTKNMVIFRDCDLCKPNILPGVMVILRAGPSKQAWEEERSAYLMQ